MNTKIAYRYADDTKEFMGETFSYEDPEEEGRFPLPANSTFTPPPQTTGNNVIVLDENDNWFETEDHRGKILYSVEKDSYTMISFVGPIDDNLYKKEKPEKEKTVYFLYDATTKEITGKQSFVVGENPENSTDKSPAFQNIEFSTFYIKDNQKYTYVFAKNKWTDILDLRGETWYSINTKEPIVIDTLGNPSNDLVKERPVSFDEVLNNLKSKRNLLLAQSDWTQLNDSPLSINEIASWKSYRQSLRALPEDLTTIEEIQNVVWPNPPE